MSQIICPICKRSDCIKLYGETNEITLYQCYACRFAFQNRLTYKYPYSDIDYYDPRNQPSVIYPITTNSTDVDRLSFIHKKVKSGKILEIGGGLGSTSIYANNLGYEVYLIEESKNAVSNGKKYHPTIHWINDCTIPESIKLIDFNIVMMFHVLEHIIELDYFMNQLTSIANKGTHVIVEVPNWDSLERKFKKMDWLYILDHHPNQFSKYSLLKLFSMYGFYPINIEYRRTFAINEKRPYREYFKKILCLLGFSNVIRICFVKS
jgi:hypothetical protein